jgi:hypothetical protein
MQSAEEGEVTKLVRVGILVLGILAGPGSVFAAEDEIMSVVKSGVCPKVLFKMEAIKYSEYCKGFEERSCNDSNNACFDEAADCWKEVNRLNKEIYTYNNFIQKCAKGQ